MSNYEILMWAKRGIINEIQIQQQVLELDLSEALNESTRKCIARLDALIQEINEKLGD